MRLKPSFERWFGRNRRVALRWDRLPNRVHSGVLVMREVMLCVVDGGESVMGVVSVGVLVVML